MKSVASLRLPVERLLWNTWKLSGVTRGNFERYSQSENGNYIKINASLIPAKGSSTQGASYEFIDSGLRNGKTYYYKLEDIELNGKSTMHGPATATPRLFSWIGK